MAEIEVKFMNTNSKAKPINGTVPQKMSEYTIDEYVDRMTSPVSVKLNNPETREPIAEIVLDVLEEPSFKGHDGVLNECFDEGIKKYGHQSGLWEPRTGENWGVWFPKFLSYIDGKPKAANSGWVNTISDDGLSIFEYTENSEGEKDAISTKWFSKNYIRLVFAYIPKKDRYVFEGAFVANEELSKPFKHVFTRIATKVKIVGKPAYILWLLDDARSNDGGKLIEEPLDEASPIEDKIKQANHMDLESLKKAAIKHSLSKPVQKDAIVKQIYRDPYIAEYAKKRANGICQLCGLQAPFKDKDGKPYLESHHIIWLSNGGSDSIDNTVALCPNCHKKMHVVNDAIDVAHLLKLVTDV